jgi:AraC-like DNA-binding protein
LPNSEVKPKLITHFYIPQYPLLKNVIHSFWQVDGQSVFQFENIIPKGVVEIIFNFSDTYPIGAELNGKQFQVKKCFINGFNTAPIKLQLPDRQVFFGVQLQPTIIKRFIGAPSCEFSDTLIELQLVNDTIELVWEQLAECNSFEKRVSIFSALIEEKLIDSTPQEKLLNNFLNDIHQHSLSVKDVASSLCYSPRHLSRKIFEATGVNTEEILQYKKYLHAMHLIHHTDLSLTEIAYQSNFSDQSHFIKTFRHYSKMTPGDYKRNKGQIKGHLFKDVR